MCRAEGGTEGACVLRASANSTVCLITDYRLLPKLPNFPEASAGSPPLQKRKAELNEQSILRLYGSASIPAAESAHLKIY
jgi:hypothetical protein